MGEDSGNRCPALKGLLPLMLTLFLLTQRDLPLVLIHLEEP